VSFIVPRLLFYTFTSPILHTPLKTVLEWSYSSTTATSVKTSAQKPILVSGIAKVAKVGLWAQPDTMDIDVQTVRAARLTHDPARFFPGPSTVQHGW
jgi:hypothetical protein